MEKGRFISFEGGEGGGKTTQLSRLAGLLKSKGIDILETREPGGTPQGELLRDLLVRGEIDRWQPMSELLMMNAARVEHVHQVIQPALDAGKWVLCDRFVDSSYAYQGIAGGLGLKVVQDLHALTLDGILPDLTVLLDLPTEAGLARAAKRGGDARFEKKGTPFHQKLRDGFLQLAADSPERFVKVDASQSFDLVWKSIETEIVERFSL
jgi:dTMP kinase